ncbi:hypothetical protein VSX64_18060 [Aurantimonas sp. C2-6-R+9]|uniref:hypothetical protein n=1 Tax=unclassified Aurantimonas TaxID=2638230 RepID=UPI002E1802C9|nr:MULTISPECIES: hypothetical protein [unclassified Aurantimonas]MEC5291938.1 hypothetical protein [Aurantimonas sp. C2-3-R2]MEC5382747.1 hypothetical protein [Aurantimonas sp. C2-6-R+9]MEC5413024.1 hypothetical protein [Aurantimonas sp. C2-4-R8]
MIRKLSLSSVILGAATSSAFAQDGGLGGVAENLNEGLLGPVGDLLLAGAFILGVVAAIFTVMTLVKNNKNPHDPASSPAAAVKWGIVAAVLIALPTFLGLNVETFFGTGGETSEIGGQLRSIN